MPKEGRYWSSNPIASIWACELQPFSLTSPLETFRGNWSLAAKTKERAVFGGRLSFVLLSFDTAITRSMQACVTLRDLSSYVFSLSFSSVNINSSNNNISKKGEKTLTEVKSACISNGTDQKFKLQYIHGTSLADNYYQLPLYFDFLAGYRMNYRKILRIMLVFRSY